MLSDCVAEISSLAGNVVLGSFELLVGSAWDWFCGELVWAWVPSSSGFRFSPVPELDLDFSGERSVVAVIVVVVVAVVSEFVTPVSIVAAASALEFADADVASGVTYPEGVEDACGGGEDVLAGSSFAGTVLEVALTWVVSVSGRASEDLLSEEPEFCAGEFSVEERALFSPFGRLEGGDEGDVETGWASEDSEGSGDSETRPEVGVVGVSSSSSSLSSS